MRYFLEISYNGTPYHGWQRQPNAISIQQVLEQSLTTLLQNNTSIVGAGRTDAGVHAKKMIAHFDSQKAIETLLLVRKLNSILPLHIAVHNILNVQPEAHARFDATKRAYKYYITLTKDPFLTNQAYYIKRTLNVDAMVDATKILLKHRDFKCFSKSKTDVKTYHCHITEAYWQRDNDQLIFNIVADRFLRNMVRAIVGTLLEVGMHKIKVEDVTRIIKSRDRSQAGYSVPAHGLYLTEVEYPTSIFI